MFIRQQVKQNLMDQSVCWCGRIQALESSTLEEGVGMKTCGFYDMFSLHIHQHGTGLCFCGRKVEIVLLQPNPEFPTGNIALKEELAVGCNFLPVPLNTAAILEYCTQTHTVYHTLLASSQISFFHRVTTAQGQLN